MTSILTSGFALPAALLVLVAVAFAVSMLWRSSRPLALGIAIALPLAAAGLYAWQGTPAALAPGATDPVAETPEVQVANAFAELDARTQADADDWEAWALKGRMHMELQQFDAARDALARAHALAPDNDSIAVGYAESLMRTSADRRFPPEALVLIERAASANPPDERAVFFLGMHKALSGAPGEAADLWESLLPRLNPNAANALRPQIAAAREAAARMGGEPVPTPAPTVETGPVLDVTIDVAPALAAQAKPGSILYVFARPAGAGGPPIAVERVVVGAWPVTVKLSDADSPMPTAKLSSAAQVDVTARLAHAGDAMASSGDLESNSMTAATASGKPVRLVLSKVRP